MITMRIASIATITPPTDKVLDTKRIIFPSSSPPRCLRWIIDTIHRIQSLALFILNLPRLHDLISIPPVFHHFLALPLLLPQLSSSLLEMPSQLILLSLSLFLNPPSC